MMSALIDRGCRDGVELHISTKFDSTRTMFDGRVARPAPRTVGIEARPSCCTL